MIAFKIHFIFQLFAVDISSDNRDQLLVSPGKTGAAKTKHYLLPSEHCVQLRSVTIIRIVINVLYTRDEINIFISF